MHDSLSSVSEIQRRCLRLVGEGHNSKEIAPLVGLSHQTVDQYVRRATTALGERSRFTAAARLREIEQNLDVQSFEFRSDGLVSPIPMNEASLTTAEVQLDELTRFGLPRIGGPPNDLGIADRLQAISRTSLLLVIVMAALVLTIHGVLVAISWR